MPASSRRSRCTIMGREGWVALGALGLVLGLSWASEHHTCAQLTDDPGEIEVRDVALASFAQERCDTLACEHVEIRGQGDCVAKIELRAERADHYGEVVGTYVTTEGLRYSPALRRWRTRHILADRQILGLPTP